MGENYDSGIRGKRAIAGEEDPGNRRGRFEMI